MDQTTFVSHLGRVIKFNILSRPAQTINDSEDSIFGHSEKQAVELQAVCFKFSTERRCFEEEMQSSVCISWHEGTDGRILKAKCVRESHTGLILPFVLLQSCKSTHEYVTSIFVFASSSNKIFLYGECTSRYAIPVGNVHLTDGPCACWRINELNSFQFAKRDPTSGRFEVSGVMDMSQARASSIMHCSMGPQSDLHIVYISQLKGVDEKISYQWNSLRSTFKNPCSITTCNFVPIIYASIACCILVMIPEQENAASPDKQEEIGERPPSPSSSAVSQLKNTTYVATSMKQLLKFVNGTFCKLASIPFDDAVDIAAMETRGEMMLVVRSKGGETCAISCSTFQVIQEWKNVWCLHVDDILGNGRDQLLMILNPSKDHALQSFPEFILTDMDLCLVRSCDQLLHDGKDQGSDDALPSRTPRSLVTAMQSLEAKVESGLMSLREQEQSRRLKERIISKSMENLAQMAAGISNPPQKQSTLIHLCGATPTHLPSPTSRKNTAERLKVNSGWQRIFNDKWIIGCTVTNENKWSVSDVKLLVLPWKSNSSHHEPVGCEGYVRHPLLKGSPVDSAAETDYQDFYTVPPSKRSKLQDIHDPPSARGCASASSVPSYSSSSSSSSGPGGRLSSLLLPGQRCDAVAMTMIPDFMKESIASRLLVLQWTSQHPFPQGEKRHRMMICGYVHVGVADVLGCKLAVNIPDVSPMIIGDHTLKTPHDIEKQDLSRTDELAMDTLQLSISVRVTSRYIPLPNLQNVLFRQMKFQRTGQDGCLCNCDNGVLKGSRVYLDNLKSNNVLLQVCTRGMLEQMLFFHTLKSILPVDVEFTLDTSIEHMEEAIRQTITKMNNELHHTQDTIDMACSTTATGTCQSKRDGEGSEETPMEVGGGSNSNELERLKRLREEFLMQQQITKSNECSLFGDEARSLCCELLQLRENTDDTVTILSRCI